MPDADVDVYAKGDIYGSVVAEDFTVKSRSNFHYDVSLREGIEIDETGAYFVIDKWQED